MSARADNCIDCHLPRQESKVITFRTAGKLMTQRYRNHTIGVYQSMPRLPRLLDSATVHLTIAALASASPAFSSEPDATAKSSEWRLPKRMSLRSDVESKFSQNGCDLTSVAAPDLIGWSLTAHL